MSILDSRKPSYSVTECEGHSGFCKTGAWDQHPSRDRNRQVKFHPEPKSCFSKCRLHRATDRKINLDLMSYCNYFTQCDQWKLKSKKKSLCPAPPHTHTLGRSALGGGLGGRNWLVSVYFTPDLWWRHVGPHSISSELKRHRRSLFSVQGNWDLQEAVVSSNVQPRL